MHTEHLQNIRPAPIGIGWLIAIAVTSLAVFVFEAMGVATFGPANTLASLAAVLIGFAAGGFVTGFLARRAPILHGIGIGLTSIVLWVVVNLAAYTFGFAYTWYGLGATATVGVVLAQIVAAIVGALVGYNLAVRGKPGLSEEMP